MEKTKLVRVDEPRFDYVLSKIYSRYGNLTIPYDAEPTQFQMFFRLPQIPCFIVGFYSYFTIYEWDGETYTKYFNKYEPGFYGEIILHINAGEVLGDGIHNLEENIECVSNDLMLNHSEQYDFFKCPILLYHKLYVQLRVCVGLPYVEIPGHTFKFRPYIKIDYGFSMKK